MSDYNFSHQSCERSSNLFPTHKSIHITRNPSEQSFLPLKSKSNKQLNSVKAQTRHNSQFQFVTEKKPKVPF